MTTCSRARRTGISPEASNHAMLWLTRSAAGSGHVAAAPRMGRTVRMSRDQTLDTPREEAWPRGCTQDVIYTHRSSCSMMTAVPLFIRKIALVTSIEIRPSHRAGTQRLGVHARLGRGSGASMLDAHTMHSCHGTVEL